MSWEAFAADYDAALVVLSRKRPDVLHRRTDRHLTGYHLFHSGPGYDRLTFNCLQRHPVPDGLVGLSKVRNHAMRTLGQRWLVFFDDDITGVRYVGGPRYIDLDPAQVQLLVMDLIVTAEDTGAYVFGISENDIRKSSPLHPTRHRAVVGGLIGVRGRDQWFDERNVLKVDYDFCLESIRRHRLLLKDQRYFLAQDRNTLPGGNMELRTKERERAEVANLIEWWGADVISYRAKRQTMGLSVHVP